MSYKSFHPGAVTYAEILNQLSTFTNDGGNVFERAMLVSNLRTFFQNALTTSIKSNHSGLIKVEFLRCRRDGTSYIGFGKNDILVECSKDPAAIGTAVIARYTPNNKPFYGMNFIVSPDLSKKIFGDEDITMFVSFVFVDEKNDKKEDVPDQDAGKQAEKSDDNRKSEQSSDVNNGENTDEKADSDSADMSLQSPTEPEKTEESKEPEPERSHQTEESGSMAQAVKAGMIPMSPVKPGKHGNKR